MRNEAVDIGLFRPDRASLSWRCIKATGTALGFPAGPWGCMLTGAVCVETRGDKSLFTSQSLAFLSDCPPLPKHTLAVSLPLQGLQIAWAEVATQRLQGSHALRSSRAFPESQCQASPQEESVVQGLFPWHELWV